MTNPNFHPASYKQATGKAAFGLTNDYMFRAVFQKNNIALKGLISSVLHMPPETIKNVVITNPIKLGKHHKKKHNYSLQDKTLVVLSVRT